MSNLTSEPVCRIEGCAAPIECKELCNKHYLRQWKYGDPLHVVKVYGEVLTYSGWHQRLRRVRGAATTHPCSQCGGPAAHWAFDRAWAGEVLYGSSGGADGIPYAVSEDAYLPMCVPCHKVYDLGSKGEKCLLAL